MSELNELQQMFSNGITVYPNFSHYNQDALDPLRESIQNAITSALKDRFKKMDENSKKATTNNNKQLEALKQLQELLGIQIEEAKKSEKSQAKTDKSVGQELAKVNESGISAVDIAKKTLRVSTMIVQGVTKLSKALYKFSEKQANQIAQLSLAGISSNKSLTDQLRLIVQNTGMTRDTLIKHLTSSSPTISKLSRLTKNDPLELYRSAYQKVITGKGMTEADTLASVKYYIESSTALGDATNLSADRIGTAADQAAKSLKMLSYATGKSVEQITQEIEAREKTLLNKRFQSDPKTARMYEALVSMGQNEDIIQYVLSGKMSDVVARNMATPEGLQMIQSMREIALRYGGSGKEVEMLSKLGNSSIVRGLERRQREVNPTLLAYAGNEYASILGADISTNFGALGGLNDKDSDRIDAIKKLNAELNIISDKFQNWEFLSPEQIKGLTDFVSKANVFVDKFSKEHPGITYALSLALTTLKSIGSEVLLISLFLTSGLIKPLKGLFQLSGFLPKINFPSSVTKGFGGMGKVFGKLGLTGLMAYAAYSSMQGVGNMLAGFENGNIDQVITDESNQFKNAWGRILSGELTIDNFKSAFDFGKIGFFIADTLGEKVGDMAYEISKWIKDFDLKETMQSIYGKVSDFTSGIVQSIKDFTNELIDAIKGKLSEIDKILEGTYLGKAVDFVKNWFGGDNKNEKTSKSTTQDVSNNFFISQENPGPYNYKNQEELELMTNINMGINSMVTYMKDLRDNIYQTPISASSQVM
jgi:hypothetical protein